MRNNTGFGTYLYSVGTPSGNLIKLPVTVSKVADFIPRAQVGNFISKTNAVKSRERDGKK